MDIKTNYIILSKNVLNNKNVGSNLYIKSVIIHSIIDETPNDTALRQFFLEQYSIKYKNRVILSQTLDANKTALTNNKFCFITKNNIKNNIKFIFDNNKNHGKILFVKNQNINDNSYNYLIENLDDSIRNPNIINPNPMDLNQYLFHLNYYFKTYDQYKSNDYYKINLKDYIYKYTNNEYLKDSITQYNNDLCYNLINFKILDFSNNNYFSNITNNNSESLINYKKSDFDTLFIDNKNNFDNIINYNDISLNKLEINNDQKYQIYNNIYSYNKLTLDFSNNNFYTFQIDYSNNPIDLSYVINTFLIKTNNFTILNNKKNNSKIIFDNNNIYLKNLKVTDNSNNFFYNNFNSNKLDGSKNTIFLSCGNGITGLTQYDLYNNTHFYKNASTQNLSKIIFSKNINNSLINRSSSNQKYTELASNKDNLYLLDLSLNNVLNNINNTINYNNILYNYYENSNSKIFNLNFNNFIDICNSLYNNYYNNSFNNIEFLNTKSNDYFFELNNNIVNNNLNFKLKDLTHDINAIINDKDKLITDTIYSFDLNANYNFKFNYNSLFYTSLQFDILLNNNFDLCNNYPFISNNYGDSNYYNLLNFYSLQISNLVSTTGASDFENVDCIFVYHDPINDTDENFRYPNNNIEIIRDPNIDTLSKAIEVLPGARTSRTNSVFIPAKNGSNLSRKMIQGLIGLDNVPKLLSIEPYDPSFINGRGFINQFQINDTCISSNYEEQVKLKINATKHESVKEKRTFKSNVLKRQNFANLVKSNARNKLSQTCANNLNNNQATTQVNYSNIPPYTPFKFFYTGKGHYLGPK